MKVFIWKHVKRLTDSHSGGLVVIADNEQDAMIMALSDYVSFSEDEKPEVYKLDDKHLGCGDRIFIFKDSDCC